MRFSIKRMGQRGVTLVELVIALALIAILSTTSVLMCDSIASQVKYNRETSSVIENLTLTRSYIEKCFYTYDNNNYKMEIEEENLVINDNNKKKYIVSVNLDNSIITFDYPDTTKIHQTYKEYTFDGIKKIKFEEVKIANNESTNLYKCTIEYDESEFFFILLKNSK